MKKFLFIFTILVIIISCSSNKSLVLDHKKDEPIQKKSDTIRIANDSLEYEVIIIDGGFNTWLNSQSKPRGFYTETYLENKNQIYVREWNNRVLQPQRFNPNLYEMQINYNTNIHYGYEVNYLIYNYMVYFQITNKQQLAGFVPSP